MAIRRSGHQATTRNLDRGFLKRLRKAQRDHKRSLLLESLEKRHLLATGPVLLGVQPNEGDVLANGKILNVAPQHLTFRFNEGQVIDAATLQSGIKVTRAGLDGVFGNANDVVITPGAIVVNDDQNEVTMRFAEPLVDDLYRIDVIGAGATPLRNTLGDAYNGGVNTSINFELDLGALVTAVVPQPIVRTSGGQLQWGATERSQIEVYFNADQLDQASATNKDFYQLYFTGDTATNTDDVVYKPVSVTYTAAQNKVLLTFAAPLDQLGSGAGTFRLRIGTSETVPLAPTQTNITADPGSSYSTAKNIGTLGNQSQILSSIIDPQAYALQYPGGNTMPGNRDIYTNNGNAAIEEGNDQVINPAIDNITPDTTSGPTVMYYNFKDVLGFQNPTTPYLNQITENQKQRTREVFEIFSRVAGIQFIESPDKGITVATGDLRVGRADILTGAGDGLRGEYFRLGDGSQLVIMDGGETDWEDTYGGNWFREAMKEIGRAVGLEYDYDMPAGTIMAGWTGNPTGLTNGETPEPIFPGDQDIVNLQRLYRPDSIDIDLYRFNLTQAGTFSAETLAERLNAPSLLNTNLNLYMQDASGKRTLIARNDDYFSQDSFLELHLEPGTYFIGVSASGNNQYDPAIENTGIGGRSAGAYDLKINFKPDLTAAQQLVDKDHQVAFDGDADGTPGGTYNFWFRAQTTANTLIVDKNAANNNGTGTLAAPFKEIDRALAAAQPGQIVRIVGNGGTDNNLATIGDNKPYEIGFNSFGAELPDGASLTVPKGVTVMVDAGAILKFRRAAVVVGSTSATVDKSGSAFQVLGKPGTPVYLTSWGDQATGVDTDPLPTTPAQGDWGGILYRNDIDNAAGRFNYENAGVFLNYVNNAMIRYGGGSVVIGSVPQTITPVQMVDARPEVSWNNIQFSSVAGLAANPNSFEETNFNAPQYQTTAFTADYDRVGPDVHRNTLLNNTLNGLLIRVDVAPDGTFPGMTVSGRFDDADIVHIVQNTLQIRGTAGGPVEDASGNRTARLDGRLAIDSNIVVKLDSGRIEALMGGQLIAEASAGNEVIFTSILDDTYGAGGTFKTSVSPNNVPAQAGDWAGIYVGPYSSASFDNAVFQYGGGVSSVEGTFTAFNVLEINQSTVRVTDSVFRKNAEGVGGDAPPDRFGRGVTTDATIAIRGAQPIIMGNTFRGNGGAVISVNANALNGFLNADVGRSTGLVELNPLYGDNQGPLVRLNRLADNGLNGMVIRGAVLTTESTWDDTDIVHILRDQIIVPDFHNYGGLTLRSNPTESLVVKAEGANAGITTDGTPLDINDRVGGRLSVIGLPGYPVIMTSLSDDSVGAGYMPNGQPQVDTNGDSEGSQGSGTLPTIGEVDRGTLIDNDVSAGIPGQFAFDVDVGGASGSVVNKTEGGITAQGTNNLFINENAIFAFLNYIKAGSAGAFELGTTTITQQPTLISPDHVVSKGSFQGANGLVRWTVDSYLLNGVGRVYNELTLDSDAALGDISFINYLDEDVLGVSDDILYTTGTPGQDDFRAYTLDNAERIGFAQGGVLTQGEGLVNATYAGWAADQYDDLENQIIGGSQTFSTNGNIDTADLPLFTDPELGDVHGLADVTTAFAWTVDPTAHSAKITTFLELVATNPGQQSSAGDWQGLKIGEYANDRNVITVQEAEASTSIAVGINNGVNATPDKAQLIGQLAPNEKSGDENRRLGFEVHGYLSQTSDVDVYSFKANSGTEVWLDLDRTTQSLDAVLELVDANGVVIARSNNSEAEGDQLESLYKYDRLINVNGLQKSTNATSDLYTTNPRDAGMRVVLPGPASTTNTYYVRVRSASAASGLADNANLDNGLTSGAYQLQIRLGEVDEVPGTTVRYADIRYATNGIQVLGQPTHSPLLGETSEAEQGTAGTNNVRINSQYIGNLGAQDRGAIAVSGNIANGNDVDWYSFDVKYEGIEDIPGHTDLTPEHYSTVLDLDYADGLGRGNFSIYVFDSAGTLVYTGQDSNVASDRPAPASGATAYDATRGSFGTKDASIGPIELPEGQYYVAISSTQQIPSVLQQNFQKTLDESQKIVRREPIDSTQRISEDHLTLDPFGNRVEETTTAGMSDVPILFDGSSVVPYTLGDLTLFSSVRGNASDTTFLNTIDAFTGNVKTVMTQQANFDYEDLMITPDGRILAFNNETIEINNPVNDASSGHLLQIDPVTGAATDLGTTTITTHDVGANGAEVSFGIGTGQQDGVGVHPNAITMFYDPARGPMALFIGNRGDLDVFGSAPASVTRPRNIMYQFNPNTGAVLNPDGSPDYTNGAEAVGVGTQKREWTAFNTATGMVNNTENITGAAYVPPNIANATDTTAGGSLVLVTNQGRIYLGNLGGVTKQLNGGARYLNPTTGQPLNFQAVAKLPLGVELNGLTGTGGLNRIVIASTNTNELYAINVDTDKIMPVFFDGNRVIPINAQTFAANAKQPGFAPGFGGMTNALVFTLQGANSWGWGARNPSTGLADDGPGLTDLNDGSTVDGSAGDLIKFQFNDVSPGGKSGTLMSNPFSLEGYSSSDKPYLYLDYSLFSSDFNFSPSQFTRDSVRVYIGTPDGDWHLAATNDDYRTWSQFAPAQQNDEFDIDDRVQSLFDRTDPISTSVNSNFNWRQLRVSLDDFAGQSGLRIRVEAATSGTSYVNNSNYTGYEIQTKAGRDLRDGQEINIDNSSFFEIDLGTTLVLPSGGMIPNNEKLTLTAGGFTRTYTFVRGGTASSTVIPITPNMEPEDVARALYNAIAGDATASAALAPFVNGNRLNLRGAAANGFKVDPTIAASSYITRDGEEGTDNALSFPSGGGIIEGEKFTLTTSDGVTRTYEFDKAGNGVASGNVAIVVTANMSASAVAQAAMTAIVGDATANAAFAPLLNGNRIRFHGRSGNNFDVTPAILDATSAIARTDGKIVRINAGMEAYTSTQNVRDVFREALANAFVPDDPNDPQWATKRFQAYRAYDEFVRLTMHEVIDAGPFGINKGATLEGAEFGENVNNYTNPNTQTSAFTGDNNAFEGMYIDDIYIGFAERGEMVTQAVVGADTFVANNATQGGQRLNWDESYVAFPTQAQNQVVSGPYRLEIRQGSNYGEPLETYYNPETLALTRQFDTNELHGAGTTLVMPNGSVIPEGATLRIGDGLSAVTLEFDDLANLDGVRPGNIAVPYTPNAPASVIAAAIRDVLNSTAVRNKLPTLSAGLSDGTDGTAVATVTPTEGSQSPNNDVMLAAVNAIVPGDFTTTNAVIGDNPNLIGANAAKDVDLYAFTGRAGVPVQFRVDATTGSSLNPLIRIFDSSGRPLAMDDNNGVGNNALLVFTPADNGIYYLGVSASGNANYTASVIGSGPAGGTTGGYKLTSLGLGSSSNLVNLFGDSLSVTNTLNEQGLPLDDSAVRINTEAFLDQSGSTNDTEGSAIAIDLPTFNGTGRIGDNAATGLLTGRDVDMFKFTASAGDVISIEVQGEHNASLAPVVRVFNVSGTELAIAEPKPTTGPSERTTLNFIVPANGTYWIGVSGGGYKNYNPKLANSGSPANLNGATGVYSIKVANAKAPAAVGAEVVDALGDAKGDYNDTTATAIDATSYLNYVATGVIGDRLGGGTDVDVYKFGARFGDVFKFRIDSNAGSSFTAATPRIFNANGVEISGAAVADGAGGWTFTPAATQFLGGAANGTFYIEVAGASGSTGAYQLQFSNSNVPNVIRTIRYDEVKDTTTVLDQYDPNVSRYALNRTDMKGDSNLERDQGQIVIEANRISNSAQYGLVFDAGARSADGSQAPHQGSASVLRDLNTKNLAPGVVAVNNVIFGNEKGAIHVSGVANQTGVDPTGSVPFARIINNTLYGVGGTLAPEGSDDDGILVDENASPTLLNNIIANFARGVTVDATSTTTVQGGSLFAGNGTNSNVGLGASAITLTNSDPLFVNAGLDNFYLAAGSKAIDSSVDSLADRAELVAVRNPLGISQSPILAPDLDATGQARVPASPTANVFRDRGAIDRSDFSGPSAAIINPLDNDSLGIDNDSRPTVVRVPKTTVLTNFIIQLYDSTALNDPVRGTGVDVNSVDPSKVQVFRDGELLTPGTDYSFSFDGTNKQIRLTPLSGVWQQNSAYLIKLDNSDATGIRDLADNLLQANQLTGETIFQVFIGNGYDYGDAPDPTYPTLISSNGARHEYNPDVRLGDLINPKANGLPSVGANSDVDDDGVTFDRTLLPGGAGIVTVKPSVDGFLSVWFDWNHDGDWSDPNEQVFGNKPVVAGDNTLQFTVDKNALLGDTYARFRFSTQTISGFTGDAVDGEVEDYKVTVSKSSWQNQNGGKYGNLNVSDDYLSNGKPKISAFDVLLLVSKINESGTTSLLLPDPPTVDFAPPPFYDVDGNGVLTPEDARIVLDFLDAPPPDASGEAGSASNGAFAFSFGATSGQPSGSSVLDVGLTSGAAPSSSGSTTTTSGAASAAVAVAPAANQNVVSPQRAAASSVRRAEAAVASVPQTQFSGQSAEDFDALLSVIASGSGKKKSGAEAADAIFGELS